MAGRDDRQPVLGDEGSMGLPWDEGMGLPWGTPPDRACGQR
jgi:hypothetical protein